MGSILLDCSPGAPGKIIGWEEDIFSSLITLDSSQTTDSVSTQELSTRSVSFDGEQLPKIMINNRYNFFLMSDLCILFGT